MNDQQTLAVLDELAALDTDGCEEGDVLARVAGALAASSGAARVDLHCVAIESGASQPRLEARVSAGSSHPASLSRPASLAALALLGERPILGDLTPVTAKLVALEKGGPAEHLLVRVRTPHLLAWASIELGGASRDVAAWSRGVERVVRALTRRIELRETTAPRAMRRGFFDAMLDWRHVDVERDLCKACEFWRVAARADGAILWMYNQAAQAYEIAAYDVDPRGAKLDLLDLRKTPEGDDGIGHYASQARRAVRVADIAGWKVAHGEKQYHVMLAEPLARLGCRGLVCVPLLERDDRSAPEFADVVTLHYCQRELALALADESLLTMGRVTRQFVRSTLEAQERRVQSRLGQLTKNHLTRSIGAPKQSRDKYLAELLALIQRELRVDGVSIFFRARFKNRIACLASTGLVDAGGKPIEPRDWPSVGYERGEGWTGECYATNKPVLFPSPGRDAAQHVARFSELRRELIDGREPFLLQPIPTDPAAPDAPDGAIGVIRCVGHRSALFRDHYTQFRPAVMELLRAIAIDVSPILQTLQARVERELTISILKHELKTPLGMILDTSRKLVGELSAAKPPREVDLRDVEVCAAFGMNLALQLEADPLTFTRLRRTSVHIEGDIVARVSAMLRHYAREAKGMTIRFGDFRSIPPLSLDRDLIEQALQNLIVNAIKYGERGSRIEIEARPPDANASYFIVDVTNRGIGVEEDEKEQIFLPNYRSPHVLRTAQPGVGLGLSIAREALRAHGGDVHLTRAKDPTIFSLYIPKFSLPPTRSSP